MPSDVFVSTHMNFQNVRCEHGERPWIEDVQFVVNGKVVKRRAGEKFRPQLWQAVLSLREKWPALWGRL